MSNPRRPTQTGRFNPDDVRVTVDGEELDFSPLANMPPVATYARGTVATLRSLVLSVPGVTECEVEFDRRAQSVRAIVTGGENAAIAEALYNALPAGVETTGDVGVEMEDEFGHRLDFRFDRPQTKGFACGRCKGGGQLPMTFTFHNEPGLSTTVRCSTCLGLGCDVLAKWAERNRYRIDRHGDEVAVVGWREPERGGWRSALVGVNPPIIKASLGVVLFWALAHEIAGATMFDPDGDLSGVVTMSYVVECIAACSRPLCRLPDRWNVQIDARSTEVVIDEVVDGRAVRRMGKLTEVARRRADGARKRRSDELAALFAAWDESLYSSVDEAEQVRDAINQRAKQDLAVIRDSIAGVDPDEPEWYATWWLALREWTGAGKEPDADAMADILRGLSETQRTDRRESCVCDHNPDTTDGPDEDCPVHGREARPDLHWRVSVSLGYHAELPSRLLRSLPEPFALVDGDSFGISVDDGPPQQVVFQAFDFVDLARATASEVATVIVTQLVDVVALVDGGRVTLTGVAASGESCSVEIVSGSTHALASLGFSTGGHEYEQRRVRPSYVVLG